MIKFFVTILLISSLSYSGVATKIARDVMPSVVTIVFSQKKSSSQLDSFVVHKFNSSYVEEKDIRLCSGSLISKNGLILSSAHCFDQKVSSIKIVTYDNRWYDVRILNSDRSVDLALLQVVDTNETFNFLKISDKRPQLGDDIFVLGSPRFQRNSITSGIVSALNIQNIGVSEYEGYIKVDAPINFGNSGGPLVNESGQLVGVISAMLRESQNIGFVTDIKTVQRYVDMVLLKGKFEKSRFGIKMKKTEFGELNCKDLDQRKSYVMIDKMFDDQPSQDGIQVGDVILQIGDVNIDEKNDVKVSQLMVSPGEKINFLVLRDCKMLHVNVVAKTIYLTNSQEILKTVIPDFLEKK